MITRDNKKTFERNLCVLFFRKNEFIFQFLTNRQKTFINVIYTSKYLLISPILNLFQLNLHLIYVRSVALTENIKKYWHDINGTQQCCSVNKNSRKLLKKKHRKIIRVLIMNGQFWVRKTYIRNKKKSVF